jgi:Flp pilus assembly protein TadD
MGAGANSRILALLLAWMVAASLSASNQSQRKASRQRIAVESADSSALLAQAEAAIEKEDYALAERLLKRRLADFPEDHRAWFDLGFVYRATDRRPEAVEAYRKSVALKPEIFETNLNLGLLLASQQHAEAETYLRRATELKPSANPAENLARAWLALGKLLENSNKSGVVAAYREATRVQPRDLDAALALAAALERTGDLRGAEMEFLRASEVDPESSEAVAGLANVYSRTNRFPEAEAALRKLLALEPNSMTTRLQLGRVLIAQNRTEEGIKELEMARSSSPQDLEIRRDLADLYARTDRHQQAAKEYRELLRERPNDSELHHALGRSLLKVRQFADAQSELQQSIQLDPRRGEAYGDLAIAAAENRNYHLALQALDMRSKFLPEIPATYFLRATCYDHLRAPKEAAENYRQFLALANGQFPDEEWKAKHRLKAIEPKR